MRPMVIPLDILQAACSLAAIKNANEQEYDETLLADL